LAHAFNDAPTSDDPKATLHAYADAFLNYIAVKRNLWNALFEFRRTETSTVPDWYVEAIASLIRILAISFHQLRPDLPQHDALASSQLVFASIHAVVSLESSGRLALVMDRDIREVAHDLVDMHVLAFQHRPV
jgi:AcrR family transcriptional regulator